MLRTPVIIVIIGAVGLTAACSSTPDTDDGITDRTTSAVGTEPAWCAEQWATGGLPLTPEERSELTADVIEGGECNEARVGLRKLVSTSEIRKVSALCTGKWGTFSTSDGRIRINDVLLGTSHVKDVIRVLAHEYGHLKYAQFFPGFDERDFTYPYNESYVAGTTASHGKTYEVNCMHDVKWTMQKQIYGGGALPGWGGGGGPNAGVVPSTGCSLSGPCQIGQLVDQTTCEGYCGGAWGAYACYGGCLYK